MTTSPDPTPLTDEALWCRTERHPWQWQHDSIEQPEGRRRPSYFIRISACSRCGATRHKRVSLITFRVEASGIKYPKNYLVHGGRLDVAEVYREQFARREERAT